MAYTTINKSSDYFNTILYTGTGGTQTLTGVGFESSFNWLKRRDSAAQFRMIDQVRGGDYSLSSASTAAQDSQTNRITAWSSDGFTVGATSTNPSGASFVAWNWKGNGSGSANTDGDINSTVSASTTSGFSIVKYTGTGSTTTVGHGLGATPKFYFIKRLGGTSNWVAWHNKLPTNNYFYLNSSDASGSSGYTGRVPYVPTSNHFAIGNDNDVNNSGDSYIAYCFAEKQGYSKFGSYIGNGNADGTFIYTGFKPQFIITKRTDNSSGGHWLMYDTKRDPSNVSDIILTASDASSEAGWGTTFDIDILSNGFKMRSSTTYTNVNNANYIYMAFAEAPLVGSNNVPCTAR